MCCEARTCIGAKVSWCLRLTHVSVLSKFVKIKRKGAQSYFSKSKSSFLFHLKNHHSKDEYFKIHLNFWMYEVIMYIAVCLYLSVSLIMVTITRHIFINIFQTEHFLAVKFSMGNKLSCDSKIPQSSKKKKKKKLKRYDWGPLMGGGGGPSPTIWFNEKSWFSYLNFTRIIARIDSHSMIFVEFEALLRVHLMAN